MSSFSIGEAVVAVQVMLPPPAFCTVNDWDPGRGPFCWTVKARAPGVTLRIAGGGDTLSVTDMVSCAPESAVTVTAPVYTPATRPVEATPTERPEAAFGPEEPDACETSHAAPPLEADQFKTPDPVLATDTVWAAGAGAPCTAAKLRVFGLTESV